MGCDIHLVVEVRRGGRWQRVDPPPEARDPWLVKQAAEEKDGENWYKVRAAKDGPADIVVTTTPKTRRKAPAGPPQLKLVPKPEPKRAKKPPKLRGGLGSA